MKSISKQIGVLSSHPLVGYYRYKNLFQILPSTFQCEMLGQDHPLILEIRYLPDIWPHRDELHWYRDLWEQYRFEHIRNGATKRGLEPGDDWVKAYEQITKMNRFPAIINELIFLLTLFTNYRFFVSSASDQGWFISLDTTKDRTIKAQWGQRWYSFDKYETGTELSDTSVAEVSRSPVSEYYSRTRDAITLGEDNSILLPENIDQLFDIYFELDSERKKSFYTACHLYNKALKLSSESASLSLVATVMAIEALVNCVKDKSPRCSSCNTPESIETCDKCGVPLYRVTSLFKQFLNKFFSKTPEAKKFAQDLYITRSALAHGDLLRDDLHDSGFYAEAKDEQQMFRRNSYKVTRIAMLRWLTES